jgi:ABC-type multidrug transport system fused ATPase/permease subunit
VRFDRRLDCVRRLTRSSSDFVADLSGVVSSTAFGFKDVCWQTEISYRSLSLLTIVTGGTRAAKTVFSSMLSSVVMAPMSYFETTPMGRVLNRFTFDMDIIDVVLTEAMSMLMISCSWFIAGICVMVTILPWIGLAVLPVTIMYWKLMLHYRRSGADLHRLDAVSRSPIQAMVSEGELIEMIAFSLDARTPR